MPVVCVIVEQRRGVRSRAVVVVPRCAVAARPLARLRGLLGKRPLCGEQGLLIEPCSSIHTVGMRAAIDVLFLTRGGSVVRVAARLRPGRVVICRAAHSALELPAGRAQQLALTAGDRLRLERVS